jgi:hypothetical protein
MAACAVRSIGEKTQNSPHSHFLTNQRIKKQVKAPDNAIALTQHHQDNIGVSLF